MFILFVINNDFYIFLKIASNQVVEQDERSKKLASFRTEITSGGPAPAKPPRVHLCGAESAAETTTEDKAIEDDAKSDASMNAIHHSSSDNTEFSSAHNLTFDELQDAANEGVIDNDDDDNVSSADNSSAHG